MAFTSYIATAHLNIYYYGKRRKKKEKKEEEDEATHKPDGISSEGE